MLLDERLGVSRKKLIVILKSRLDSHAEMKDLLTSITLVEKSVGERPLGANWKSGAVTLSLKDNRLTKLQKVLLKRSIADLQARYVISNWS